tara:strand:+ start:853 stop:1149 length:297 start_codon:yes stop_codon:yes gene_type:complete
MSVLSIDQINKSLKKINQWKFNDNMISRSFKFPSYMSGINFVDSLALISEKENHHPDILVGWCEVNVAFTSHDLGGVTEKCVKMAELTSKLFEEKKQR